MYSVFFQILKAPATGEIDRQVAADYEAYQLWDQRKEVRNSQQGLVNQLRYDLVTIGYLVGGLEHEFYFSIQLGISWSQLTHIFSEG